METELKFRVPADLKPSALEKLDLSPYMLGERENHDLRDVLLDTPDQAITRSVHALRLRYDGPAVYLTLKGPPSDPGGERHQREEWQEVISEEVAADRARWPEVIREHVSSLAGQQALQPIIEVHNRRRAWVVRRDEQVVAELALDQGEIRAGSGVQALRELELELKGDGTDADLDVLAKRLRQALPLVPEPQTKLQRGLTLLHDGGKVAMSARAPLAEAGRTILREHWNKLRANEPGVREGDHEAVHDMRVATRRLRAMLEVLGGTAYDRKETDALRKGLKRLAASLGAVRDAEVWIEAVDGYAVRLQLDEREGFEPLLRSLHDRRDRARDALLIELDQKRTHKLYERLEGFVKTAGAGMRPVAAEPDLGPLRVRDVAGSVLWARLEEVQSFDRVMPQAPVEILHELRIACKHLRYTLELFGDALEPDGKALRSELIRAQDHLGVLHDADIAIPFLDTLLVDEPHNLALERYRAHLQSERDRLWSTAGEVWAIIGGPPFRMRLAAAIAAL